MEFSGEFDLALNLFSSIGFFTDDEDRLLLDRFCTGLKPGGAFVLDTRNRDFVIHDVTSEETVRLPEGTVRVKNRFDVRTSRIQQDWWLEDQHRLLGQTEIRLYSAHELLRMLRPERWSQVELFGGLDGRPVRSRVSPHRPRGDQVRPMRAQHEHPRARTGMSGRSSGSCGSAPWPSRRMPSPDSRRSARPDRRVTGSSLTESVTCAGRAGDAHRRGGRTSDGAGVRALRQGAPEDRPRRRDVGGARGPRAGRRAGPARRCDRLGALSGAGPARAVGDGGKCRRHFACTSEPGSRTPGVGTCSPSNPDTADHADGTQPLRGDP